MKVLVVILLTCLAVCAQSKTEMKSRFGDPVAETFRIRPGIVLTVKYDSLGKVAEMFIGPDLTGPIKSRNMALSFETVTAIVKELVPESERGKPKFAGFLNMGCMPEDDCAGSFQDYEKVFIYYNAAKNHQTVYAVISLKPWKG